MSLHIKPLLFAATLAAGPTATAHGAVLLHDPFLSGNSPAAGEYADAAALDGSNPVVTNFSGAWSVPGPAQDQGDLVTTSQGLTYSAGSISVGSGGAVTQANSSFDAGNSTRQTIFTNSNPNPGTVWFAALFKADSDNSNTDDNFVVFDPDTDGNSSNQIAFGIRDLGFYANGGAISGTDYAAGTTALVVGKLEVVQTGSSGNGDELLSFWFNPTDASTELALTSTAQATATANGNYTFQGWGGYSFELDLNTSANQGRYIDEIMLGETLADLNSILSPSNGGDNTPAVPEPMSAGLALAGLAAVTLRRRSRA